MVTVCRLDQVDKAVRNTLAVVPQPIADPHTVAITVALDGEIETHACNARRRLQQLCDDQRRLHRHITTIARELAETGYTYRDRLPTWHHLRPRRPNPYPHPYYAHTAMTPRRHITKAIVELACITGEHLAVKDGPQHTRLWVGHRAVTLPRTDDIDEKTAMKIYQQIGILP